jgi:hypothetical protein
MVMYQQASERSIIRFKDSPLTCRLLNIVRYRSLTDLKDNHFRIPTNTFPNEATFDAFFYDQGTATVFQHTVGATHTVKEKGLKTLKGLGVKKVKYVALTEPEANTVFKMSLSMPVDLQLLVQEQYHLAFDP